MILSGRDRVVLSALLGAAFIPALASATLAQPQQASQNQPVPSAEQTPPPIVDADPDGNSPIIPDPEFEAALPDISGDINAPLEAIDTAPVQTVQPITPPDPDAPFAEPAILTPAIPAGDAQELASPLLPIDRFDATPVEVVGVDAEAAVELRYEVVVNGLDALELDGRFRELSALEEGDGRAANATMVAARAREDEALAVRLLQSLGYYDATALSVIEPATETTNLRAVVTATPGQRYQLGSIDIKANPVTPPDLIASNLRLKVGDPIEAERIQGAEANVSLVLPQQGYPFAEVGQRDILLDETAFTGAYTLPVDTGPRSSFGGLRTEGDTVFDVDHIAILSRFDRGELYDSRMVDDLRKALVATSLFSTVSVEPERSGEIAPDGTEYVTMLVRQTAGPARTLAAEAGFSTGQGFRIEGSWTHRNLFPPEGALIASVIAGTQEQGLAGTFRKSNWGQRDRTLQLTASANRQDYEAYEAFTGVLSGRVSYDSTPIWQKRFTYSYGLELIGSNEDRFDFDLNDRVRDTYFVGAVPLFAGFDTSDDLLNPTSGYRLKLNLSPEAAINDGTRPYVRAIVEGTAYYPINDSLVIAGRARAGTIQGIERDALAPSRRFYAGGGGSVRGFGFQQLGPQTPELNEDGEPDPRPIGGRSFNEFSIEARYRFGNFGIVPFLDAGNVYESQFPSASGLRFGAGIGGRFYSNFGPFRIDIATPIGRREGEPRVALYLSIGQAF